MPPRVLKPPPPFLFRYRPHEEVTKGYLEDLLQNNHIWASLPRSFSDWHDCRAHINFKGTTTTWEHHYKNLFERIGLQGEDLSREILDAMNTGTWDNSSKHKEMSESIQGTLNNSGVICLTDTALDNRMWAEYAGNHKGICLCFDSSEAPFLSTYDVNYVSEQLPVAFDASVDEQLEAFLLTKGAAYSWEREWRHVDFNGGDGYKPISPSALRAIAFGLHAETSLKQEVIRLLSAHKPYVVLFEINKSGSKNSTLKLNLLEDPFSKAWHIIPPLQEQHRSKPTIKPKSALLLDHLKIIPPEHQNNALDTRIRHLAVRLKNVESSRGIPRRGAVKDSMAAMSEAIGLLRELVDRSGAAIPDYGEVALLLYEMIHVVITNFGKPGPTGREIPAQG